MFDGNYGIINEILKSLHIIDSNVKWLSGEATAMATVVLSTIWKSYPFFTLTLIAGLKGISSDFYEAAAIDGANAWQRFTKITLPALRSVIVTSLLLNGLWTFRNYDLISNITGGGPNQATETLPLLLYNQAFKYYNMGYASAIGIVSLLVCSIFVILAMPSLKKTVLLMRGWKNMKTLKKDRRRRLGIFCFNAPDCYYSCVSVILDDSHCTDKKKRIAG